MCVCWRVWSILCLFRLEMIKREGLDGMFVDGGERRARET